MAQPVEKDGPAGPQLSTGQARVDALLDLVTAGRAHLDTPTDSSGADRYTVHVVADLDALAGHTDGKAGLLGGDPIAVETLQQMACDAGWVRHVMKGASQPLDIGTRTPVWTAAQRRAITVRDGGRCRFAGCWRRTCDIHHVVWFSDRGPTAVDNGILLCRRHHTAVHKEGFRIIGDPGGELTFVSPDGESIGVTTPAPFT